MVRIVNGCIVPDEETGGAAASGGASGGASRPAGASTPGAPMTPMSIGAPSGAFSGHMDVFGKRLPVVAVIVIAAVVFSLLGGLKGFLMVVAAVAVYAFCQTGAGGGRGGGAAGAGRTRRSPGDGGPRFRTIADLPPPPPSGG